MQTEWRNDAGEIRDKLGRVFARPEPVLEGDSVAVIIAKQEMLIQHLEGQLHHAQRWGEAMAERWKLVNAAIDASRGVTQKS